MHINYDYVHGRVDAGNQAGLHECDKMKESKERKRSVLPLIRCPRTTHSLPLFVRTFPHDNTNAKQRRLVASQRKMKRSKSQFRRITNYLPTISHLSMQCDVWVALVPDLRRKAGARRKMI